MKTDCHCQRTTVNSSRAQTKSTQTKVSQPNPFISTYYGVFNLHPSASVIEIRRVYRELSKLYHPDTTTLPLEKAKQKFQQLNEAYSILSSPERRAVYDLQIGYSRWNVIQTPYNYSNSASANQEQNQQTKSAYLDPTDRPLSSGELFALLLMGLTFLGCLLLAIAIAWVRNSTV